MDFPSGVDDGLKEWLLHVPAAHVVVDEHHADALTAFVDERIAHQTPNGIVVDDVGFEHDTLLRLAKFPQERLQPFRARGVAVDMFGWREDGVVGVFKELHERRIARRRFRGGDVSHVGHHALREQAVLAAADVAFLADVLPEKIEDDETDDGQHDQDDGPCNGLGWLSVFE